MKEKNQKAILIIKIEEDENGFEVSGNMSGDLITRLGMVRMAEMRLSHMRIFNMKEADGDLIEDPVISKRKGDK